MISIKSLCDTKIEIIWLLLSIVLVCTHVVLATWANTDLTVGYFALFMDERITFEGVHNILHPSGLKYFLLDDRTSFDGLRHINNPNDLKYFIWSVLDGGDHRYGRSLWNTMAIFSAVPEFLFGEKGQIIAGRMTQVAILISAFILLTLTFVRHWALRFLLLASLLAMPYTNYYMSMPKPEPLQMLFIALFLLFFKKNEMLLRSWYWIFLGLAFGAKISTLPLVGIFVFATYIKYSLATNRALFHSELISAFGYFLIGFAIAVPVLIPNIVISIILFNLIRKYLIRIYSLRDWLVNIFIITFLAIANLAIAGLLFFKFNIVTGLAVWGGSTFLNTAHGSDSSLIGMGSWMNFFLHDWMIAPILVTVALIVICLILVVRLLTHYCVLKNFRYMLPYSITLVVILSGLILNLAIFAGVHRLWGFYLLPGTILFTVGMVALFENYLFPAEAPYKVTKPEHYIAILGVLLSAVITFVWWFPHCLTEYEGLANRTNNEQYARQYKSYHEINTFLTNYADKKKTHLMVSFDATLFKPQSNDRYQIQEFYGEYKNWDKNPDVIILGKNLPKKQNGYNTYVIDQSAVCLREKCYQRIFKLTNGGEILVLNLPKIGN